MRVFEHSIYDLELGARFIIRTTLLRAVTHVCVGVGEPPSVTAHHHRNTSGWTPDNRQNVEQPSTLTSSLHRSGALQQCKRVASARQPAL